jgi:ubiquinone/menaquinone biosynthesis C-methylase UbiE
LAAETFNTVIASHILEHIEPWLMIEVMDEVWRVLKPGGRIMIAAPYGTNAFFIQDPTHCNALNEITWTYFDPEHPSNLYSIYNPKPWRIEFSSWHSDGTLECVMVKRTVKENGNGKRNGKK